jgi:hypothetical protein
MKRVGFGAGSGFGGGSGFGAGSESVSVSQRYGSADPYQNVTDPEHCSDTAALQ